MTAAIQFRIGLRTLIAMAALYYWYWARWDMTHLNRRHHRGQHPKLPHVVERINSLERELGK